MRRKEQKKYLREQSRLDEESLYYIIERALEREAIFRGHNGWYGQVRYHDKQRIDYVFKYRDSLYGIDVKRKFPAKKDFSQAMGYLEPLNGIFLAYPADWAGEALYLSEVDEEFRKIGLISLTLFRSHIIRKATYQQRRIMGR